MTDLTEIRAALEALESSNRRPAVDEPADDFEAFVNQWADAKVCLAKMKDALKGLEREERKLRDALSESLRHHFGKGLKEGVNRYELSNGRQLKFDHKVARKIEPSMIGPAREAYAEPAAGDPDAVMARIRRWRSTDGMGG